MSPSAFIPFCEFGGNMSAVGVQIEEFNVPVCNTFQAKILNNQLCYEVDLNSYTNKHNIDKQLKLGFNFIMDYNEDRQITFDKISEQKTNIGLASSIVESDQEDKAFIYLNTIGNKIMTQICKCQMC